jgi:hypothetical protein
MWSPGDPSSERLKALSIGDTTMAAPHMIDPATALGQALADASPNLMRHLLSTTINALLSAEAAGGVEAC